MVQVKVPTPLRKYTAGAGAVEAQGGTVAALVDVEGSHPNLMPDLTASLDVEIDRVPGALVVPRDAIRRDGDRAIVRVQTDRATKEQPVTLGRLSAHEAVVAGGLAEGAVVVRHIAGARP